MAGTVTGNPFVAAVSVVAAAAIGAVASYFVFASPSETIDEDVSIFDLVTECDLLAAHPDDPNRVAEGVADDEIVPQLAIIACENAIEDSVGEPRYTFQLGRAYLALGRKSEAREMFSEAADEDYAAAMAYLGDIYQFGLGVDVDGDRASDYYEKAVAGDFEAAKSQIEQLAFKSDLYVSKTIAAFYERDFETVKSQSQNPALRNYVFNFVLTASKECDAFMDPISLVKFYRYRYPAGYNAEDEWQNVIIGIQTEIGEHDAGLFLERHGCEGPVAKTLMSNFNRYFRELST